MNQQFSDRWGGFFLARGDFFEGAENVDSPLHLDDVNWAVVGGIKFAIFQSDERVAR